MNIRNTLMVAASVATLAGCAESVDKLADRVFETASGQVRLMDARLPDGACPRSLAQDGTPVDSDISWWCSGFYPGTLWYVYEYTNDDSVKALAVKHTHRLDSLLAGHTDHDLGFQTMCSYGNAFRITGDKIWLSHIKENTSWLAKRYSPVTGVIKSWDSEKWEFPVIIDNMMNLELLMAADSARLRDIAYSHAVTTMKNHFREDHTCYHLVNYSLADGSVLGRQTVQGCSDDSAWARGQAWALYGYTMMSREAASAGDPEKSAAFLAQAEKVASMLLSRLPEDGIPYWDFDSPDIPDDFRDASAGAVMASAFTELSSLTSDRRLGKACRKMALRQIRALASDEYLAAVGENGNFLLRHSVGNKPGNSEVDVPLTYADYYFLEAILRYLRLPS